MKNYIIVLLFILTILGCKNEKKENIELKGIPHLTYNQMLTEHDTLVSYIKQVSPAIYFNKEVRGIDFEKHAKNLRKQISPKTTMLEYLNLVQKTINSAQDAHTNLVWGGLAEIIKKHWLPNGIEIYNYDSIAFNYVDKYNSYLSKSFNSNLNLDLVYTSGEYYNILPFEYNGKTYPKSMQLIACNNKNVHQVVNKMNELISALKWDRKRNRVYHENFCKSSNLYKDDTIKLLFIDKNKTKHLLKIAKKDSVIFKEKNKNHFGYNKHNYVTSNYFKKEKMFYAKLPQMESELGDTLSNRLKKVLKNNRVNSIVLDVRGNGGGNDETYAKFLKKIIKHPLKFNLRVGRNFSYINSKYYKINKDTVLKNKAYSFDLDSIAKLDNPKMFYIKQDNYSFVTPDSNQFDFNGKIYILQDRFIYSSTSNLSNLALKSNQLVSIGETPNLLGGLQTTPMILCLPFSKILLRIEPQIDFTNTKNKLDIFQNNVEYLVEYPIDFIYKRTTTDKKIFGKEFLYQDPMFKKVLELENK